MKADVDTAPLSGSRVVRILLSFNLVSFLGFLAVGIPLPVLPGMVHVTLGFGSIVVGIVVGLQSLVTLLTRQVAGRLCTTRGPKATTLLGLAAASASGVCYFASGMLESKAWLGLCFLVIGRLVLGLGESLFITALVAWSVVGVGARNAGRAMAWMGIAMYGALAVGAPLGLVVDRVGGFPAVAACAIVFPALGASLVFGWRDTLVRGSRDVSFLRILRLIWSPGIAMALASSGVGTITAFLTLRYRASGWSDPGAALAGFGAAYIVMRLLFGGLPDRLGGTTTAAVSLVVEATGLLMLWQASSAGIAFVGATLTGLGYSLVFPSLGVEALKRVPPAYHGMMLGAYLACFDLGLAVAGPFAGVVTQIFGLPASFAAAGAASLVSLVLAVAPRSAPARGPAQL